MTRPKARTSTSLTANINPFWVTVIIYWVISAALIISAVPYSAGRFAYPLDDTYIHMAIARNFSFSGVWGVSAAEFSSSSSSPLWTLLLAGCFRVFGQQEWIPALLNILIGTGLLYSGYCLLKEKFSRLQLTIILLLVMILSILPVMSLMGMEHTLHSLFTFLILYLVRRVLSDHKLIKNAFGWLLLLVAVLPLTRYEGIFTCVGIILVFIIHKKWREAALSAFASMLPISLYGGYAIQQGWYFLPNSVLLKGNLPQLDAGSWIAYLLDILKRLFEAPHLFILVIIALIIVTIRSFQKGKANNSPISLVLWIWAALCHLAFAKTGWFYRYEAYLVFPGLVFLIEQIPSVIPHLTFAQKRLQQVAQISLLLVSFLLASLPSILRTGDAFHDYPLAVKNNVDQQYQMARFFKQYYPTSSVAVSDIGAVSYFTNANILDLWGLASQDVAKEKMAGTYDRSSLSWITEAHEVQVAILYPYLYEEILPTNWVEVGRWKISQNVVCAFDTVAIYAPNPESAGKLSAQLKAFSKELPADVIQTGYDTTP